MGIVDLNQSVAVILSTYNGMQFLSQQLECLYQQTYSNMHIYVRDDGSTDKTLEILAQAEQNGKISLLRGNNLGGTQSFFELLRHVAATDIEYVCFCDQDDVWDSNKVEVAVRTLHEHHNTPALYCSRLELVDENLQTKGFTRKPSKIGFGNALVENIAVGCTTMLNRAAVNLLVTKLPPNVYVHDWWCYLVISCFGVVIYDSTPHIKYRQHNQNAIGAATNSIQVLQRKLARFVHNRRWISEQAEAFMLLFGDQLDDDKRQTLTLLVNGRLSLVIRIKLALSSNIWRQKFIDNWILRLVILFNRI